MAPEQVRGESADARSDIFSLGCVLFEMLTSRRLFQRETAAETMTAILRDPVPEAERTGPETSSELDCILSRCLEKNPGERFQSASDLAFSLREVLKPSASIARTDPSRRRRLRAAAVLTAVLLAAAGAVFLVRNRVLNERSGAVGPAGAERIAVLPFENLGSEDDAFFADGVTDEITGRLASVSGLAVVSRTGASHYAGTNKSSREIGGELGVKYLLTGTIRWARGQGAVERVRITPQLIRVVDDTNLWTEIYEFTMDDIFSVQSKIAGEVVSHLGLTLFEPEAGSIEAWPTASIEAYQAFLRAKFLTGQPHFTAATWLTAVSEFEKAVERDPGFAAAWAELSRAHARLVYFHYDASPARREQSRRALDMARELDPDSPKTRLAAGYFHLWVERNATAALTEFEAASRGLPNSVEVQAAMGELFRLHGEWPRALDAFRTAGSLSPRDGSAMVDVAETLWWMHRHREADDAADRAIALAPDQAWSYLSKAFNIWSWKGGSGLADARAFLEFVPEDHEWTEWSWYQQEAVEGRFAEAIARMEKDPEGWLRIKIQAAPKALFAAILYAEMGETVRARKGFEASVRLLDAAVRDSPEDPRLHSSLGVALAGLGRRKDAVREGERGVDLLPMSKDAVYGIPHVIDLAHIHTLLGEPERAIEQLEFLLARPGWVTVPWLRMDPRWRRLQGAPGFEALLAKYESPR